VVNVYKIIVKNACMGEAILEVGADGRIKDKRYEIIQYESVYSIHLAQNKIGSGHLRSR